MTLDNLASVPDVMNSQQYLTFLQEAGVYTDATYNNLIQSGAWDGVSTTDWSEVAFETGVTQRHNLSFVGGGKDGRITSYNVCYTKLLRTKLRNVEIAKLSGNVQYRCHHL